MQFSNFILKSNNKLIFAHDNNPGTNLEVVAPAPSTNCSPLCVHTIYHVYQVYVRVLLGRLHITPGLYYQILFLKNI